MAFAIIRQGDKQFRVEPGATLRVPLLDKQIGDKIDLQVLAMDSANGVRIGAPTVEGAGLTATVVRHERGDKIIVFKKKRRKQYKRTKGHRQDYTRIQVSEF